MKKKKVKMIAILLLIALIASAGYFGYKTYAVSKKTTPQNQYIIETVKKGEINVNIGATGTVYASVTKDIVANNSGEIKDLVVKQGDTVKKGDKLFKVDSEQVKQQLSSAQINLEKQKLQLNKMKSEDEIDLQNFQIKDAENNLSNAKQQYNNMVVTSPIDGVVTARNNNNGDNVQSGKAVLSIIDPTSFKVKVSVDELDISKVKAGQKAEVKFNAIEGKIYEGTVESINNVGTTTNSVTTYDVVIGINDSSGVMIGMTASVNIQVASKQEALVIPVEALTDRDGRKFVMVQSESNPGTSPKTSEKGQNIIPNDGQTQQDGQGKAAVGDRPQGARSRMNNTAQGTAGTGGKLVEVKVGLQNENFVEITEGITEGQKIMILLPQGATNTNNPNARGGTGSMGGFGGGMGGGGTRIPSRN